MNTRSQRIIFAALPLALTLLMMMQSCVTRTESDLYTITMRDTTVEELVRNQPGDRDNGIIYPSPRTVEISRTTVQYDSLVERYYPDFIRLGLFESAGLIGTGAGDNGIGSGLFGVYGFFDKDFAQNFTASDAQNRDDFFAGGLYRFGIMESRLRWFRDAANWTIGTSLYEVFLPEASDRRSLGSVLPIYVRKRYFLREDIPYVAFTPTVGIGIWPSHYVNMGASLDVGSIGGLNMRAYAGLAVGLNASYSPFISEDINGEKTAESVTFPYLGIGISVLDFLNRVPELSTEWKDHEHSSWDIGLLQVGLLIGGGETSVFQSSSADSDESVAISGVLLRLCNASVALPWLDHKLYAGTSLFNVIALGKTEGGVSILPIRVGLFQTVLQDELSVEPFVEWNYFPSSIMHIGGRLNLFITDWLNFSLLTGFVSGSTAADSEFASFIINNIGNPTDFSGAYFGLGFGFSDRIFFPEELRYNR